MNSLQALQDHRGWLRSVVHARLGEPQAVEDVMQEIASVLVRNQAPLVDSAKVAPWLYQIAVRQSLLYRRKQGRQRKLLERFVERRGPEAVLETSETSVSPLHWLVSNERAKLIRGAFDELTRRDREILLLKYEHDWSYRDLSEHLGISESAVESRLHRARQRLRTLLAKSDVLHR